MWDMNLWGVGGMRNSLGFQEISKSNGSFAQNCSLLEKVSKQLMPTLIRNVSQPLVSLAVGVRNMTLCETIKMAPI